MSRAILSFLSALIIVFCIDQYIKGIFLDGFRWYSEVFSLILTYNKGVAFSMFSFLEGHLKYIQLALIGGLFLYLLIEKKVFSDFSMPIGLIGGAALSNVYDRFVHEGVVDYFFWHYGFEFAVFNFADVMIDLGVILIFYRSWKMAKEAKST